ncbi:hypothetical protein KUTeg_013697 [Tegillarca granosa]|uniref:Carboxylic ester hydrolase n=1 Tax=Tegillarca granosa TaxID=220873 RepID=A0ABQ9EUF9_TEGGR|nr:hypothetical protein KUTeg_013697 [Tegillarca granosa]
MLQVILIYLAFVPLVYSTHGCDPPIVNTECGKVQGIYKNGAYSFRGIPYAVPPTGSKRWTRALPLSHKTSTCWNKTYQATNFGHTCIQRNPDNISQIIGSEDCLFLNVWTPSLSPGLLPVMVWIHGGSLQFSNGNWPTYSPDEQLASDTNIVYVSMNYRLHAFGFMALDILSNSSPTGTSGNYGFMDQVLALQWVQRNIRNFGGDPNKVTVFGQSSGGTSIFALLAAPEVAGLFHRAWLMSTSPVLNKTTPEAAKDNEIFLQNTGCSTITCLHNLEAEKVINSVPWDVYPYWAMRDQGDLPVKGVFDGAIAVVDGDLIPEAPFDAWKSGKGIDVPLLIGSTAQEIDFFPTQMDLNLWNWTLYEQRVRQKLGTFGRQISDEALRLYPTGEVTPEYQYTSMASDLRVSCANDILADIASSHYKSPVFRYVVTSRPSHPIHVVEIPFPASYSCHMWDIFGFFGTIKDYYTPEPERQYVRRCYEGRDSFLRENG